MTDAPSRIRLILLRILYTGNFVFLAWNAWPGLLKHEGPLDLFEGVAFSFWAALSTLSLFGVRYPLQMLPLLLLQFVYKSIWLLVVALPYISTAGITGMTRIFLMGLIADIIVIPWSHVLNNYFKKGAE